METLFLKTLYVLFFIELGTRRVQVAGVSDNPDSAWVTQRARNVSSDLADRDTRARFLIRDRDSKYTSSFDEVFHSDGTEVIRTPIRAPKANAFAERWVRTVRTECLDWMLISGRRHLERVLGVYVEHYQRGRPHRSLALATPMGPMGRAGRASLVGAVRRRDLFGGLIHEYSRTAAWAGRVSVPFRAPVTFVSRGPAIALTRRLDGQSILVIQVNRERDSSGR